MACGTMMQRTKGIKKQMNELIAQTYQRGYKAGRESDFEEWTKTIDINSLVEQGRNEAWEAIKKMFSGLSAIDLIEIFNECHVEQIVNVFSATEAVEKIRAYEDQKKQEEDKIKVGDEVIPIYGMSEPFVAITVDNDAVYGFDKNGDCRGASKKETPFKKTGRTFPQIAEVLKKMQEDKNGN